MNFFGIDASEMLLILVVGVVVVGPSRAAKGVLWFKQALEKLREWSAKLREDTVASEEGLKVDLTAFDPRQYDPRRMIKEAVAEEMQAWIEASQGLKSEAQQAVGLLQPGAQSGNPESLNPEEANAHLTNPATAKPLASLELFRPQLDALEAQKQAREASQNENHPDVARVEDGDTASGPGDVSGRAARVEDEDSVRGEGTQAADAGDAKSGFGQIR